MDRGSSNGSDGLLCACVCLDVDNVGGGFASLRSDSRDVHCYRPHEGARVAREGAAGRAGVLLGVGEKQVSSLVDPCLILVREQ